VTLRAYGARKNADMDNVLKGVLDACKGICWNDDKQVDDKRAIRCEGGDPRVEVEVEVLG
jgi:Holliday junction resolvase RusA-like endonuclease